MTVTGQLLGSPAYMAPELLEGQAARRAHRRVLGRHHAVPAGHRRAAVHRAATRTRCSSASPRASSPIRAPSTGWWPTGWPRSSPGPWPGSRRIATPPSPPCSTICAASSRDAGLAAPRDELQAYLRRPGRLREDHRPAHAGGAGEPAGSASGRPAERPGPWSCGTGRWPWTPATGRCWPSCGGSRPASTSSGRAWWPPGSPLLARARSRPSTARASRTPPRWRRGEAPAARRRRHRGEDGAKPPGSGPATVGSTTAGTHRPDRPCGRRRLPGRSATRGRAASARIAALPAPAPPRPQPGEETSILAPIPRARTSIVDGKLWDAYDIGQDQHRARPGARTTRSSSGTTAAASQTGPGRARQPLLRWRPACGCKFQGQARHPHRQDRTPPRHGGGRFRASRDGEEAGRVTGPDIWRVHPHQLRRRRRHETSKSGSPSTYRGQGPPEQRRQDQRRVSS